MKLPHKVQCAQFPNKKTEAQRCETAFPRAHSWSETESGLGKNYHGASSLAIEIPDS